LLRFARNDKQGAGIAPLSSVGFRALGDRATGSALARYGTFPGYGVGTEARMGRGAGVMVYHGVI